MTTQVRDRKYKKRQNPKENPNRESKQTDSWQWYRVLLGVITLVAMVTGWFLLYKNKQSTFAKADRYHNKLQFPVTCSSDYIKDKFDVCKPKFCARVVRDDIVTLDEARHLLSVAKKGLAYGGSSGGASILDLHSGALSKGDKFVNVYSVLQKQDSFTEKDFDIYRGVKDRIHTAIAEHFNIPTSALYLTKPTFFSRMNTSEAKTIHDEYWHPHIDKETYGSFHYTSLLYLSTYGEDFTGGRFIFTDTGTEMTVEPRLGRVSFFTSGSENVHYVEKLETGVRYAITISFTCDPDMAIPDPDVK